MKSLQHHQHGIKEVVACKRFKRLHGQHQGGMNDSVWRILKTLEPVQLEVYERQCPRVILTSWGRLWGVSPGKPQQKQEIAHRLCSSSQSRSWTSWQTAWKQMRRGQKTTERSCKNKHQHLNNSHLHIVHAHAHVPMMLRSYSACYSLFLFYVVCFRKVWCIQTSITSCCLSISGTRQRVCRPKFHHDPRTCKEAFWIYHLVIRVTEHVWHSQINHSFRVGECVRLYGTSSRMSEESWSSMTSVPMRM